MIVKLPCISVLNSLIILLVLPREVTHSFNTMNMHKQSVCPDLGSQICHIIVRKFSGVQ